MNVGKNGALSEAIKDRHIEALQPSIEKNKYEGKKNEGKILENILLNEPNGTSTGDLVLYTELHRDTIHETCKRLIAEGLIVKTNKKGKYHLTDRAYRYSTIRSRLFKQNILFRMLDWEIPIEEERLYFKIEGKQQENKDPNELFLFKFINRIGALIVYTILEATRPRKWINSNKKNKAGIISGENKDRLIVDWIDLVVDPKSLLWLFFKSPIIKKSQISTVFQPPPIKYLRPTDYDTLSRDKKQKKDREINRVVKNWLNEYSSNSRWTLKQNEYDQLVKMFKNLYPGIYGKIEGFMDTLDNKVELVRSYQKASKSISDQID